MYLIIIGAGPVGSRLIQLALDDGHDVALIERDQQRAHEAAQMFDAMIFHADIAQGDILHEAEADRASALVATTGDDATNLMTMFLGLEHGIKMLISVVNQQEHQGMFDRLGVHILVDPEKIVAKHLYDRLRNPKAGNMATLSHGEQVFETMITPESPLIDKTLAEVRKQGLLDQRLLVIALRRGKKVLTLPQEDTSFQVDDKVIVFSQTAVSEEHCAVFTG